MNPVPGQTAWDRATRVAGALAELGITRLTLVSPGGNSRELRARITDLPAEILAAVPGTNLRAGPLRIVIATEGLSWECADADATSRFAAALDD